MISVVMQSYLGDYKNAAKDRDVKLIRAINSVKVQTYKDWELLIIADGCKQTIDIAGKLINDQIRLLEIQKQRNWSGIPRNVGIEKAKGNWICYLDCDDIFGVNHLKLLAEQVGGEDWYFFDDYIWKNGWIRRRCSLNHGKCGTSNLIHKRDISERWNEQGIYASDDWFFVRNLMKLKYKVIEPGEYYVCHIPFKGGYDI